MMSKPLVSVIMGIYNCEKSIEAAIESILQQTYDNWEMIMCDDGSNDDTYLVASGYRDDYPEKIVLLKNGCNRGLNYTLNHCLRYAKGEYIARMDGDDISLPTRLEKEVRFLDEHPHFAIVSCPMIYFDEGGEIFVLDMGSPVKIETLARNLIKLSGLKPDVDIKIEYTGLRPGEKLYEEKLMAEEGLQTTPNKLIFIGNPIPFDIEEFRDSIEKLMTAAYDNSAEIKELVERIVPTYSADK